MVWLHLSDFLQFIYALAEIRNEDFVENEGLSDLVAARESPTGLGCPGGVSRPEAFS